MTRMTGPMTAMALATTLALAPTAHAQAPYRDASLPVPARVADLLGRMTIEDKFWQLFMLPGVPDAPGVDYSHGVFGLQVPSVAASTDSAAARADAMRIQAAQRFFVERTPLGIPMIAFEEGVHGLVRPGSTVFPQAIALAATWDTALVGRVGDAIADEARTRGVRQLLSPVLNIASDPRWGRVEETFGEDPFLVSRMGRAYVQAVEGRGVIATAKHFVANVGAGGRDSYPIGAGARELEEFYFPPFHDAIHAGGAHSVMSAYNSVDGIPASQNRWLLTKTLRDQWGFGGFVISDAAATAGATVLHMTEASTATAARHAIEAGLDVIFQTSWEQHRPYLAAFRDGTIDATAIDTAVARVLRAKFALGLFEAPYGDPDAAARTNASPAHLSLALDASRESIVLLKNRHARLPLRPRPGIVALIGSDASSPRFGGYSAEPSHPVSLRQALESRVGAANVRYAPGPGRTASDVVTVPIDYLWRDSSGTRVHGLDAEYFDDPDMNSAPRVRRPEPRIDFQWTLSSPAPEIAGDWFAARWTGTLTVPATGLRRLGVEGNDGYRLYLDEHVLVDQWQKVSFGRHVVAVKLTPGSSHRLRLEYHERNGNTKLKLVWDAGESSRSGQSIEAAVLAARAASVAIVAVGIEEGEFRDRASLRLPGAQEELIRRVAATGTPTIVVLFGGSAVTMSDWIDPVDAVLDAWYPGVQGGIAIADVLFGAVDPSGRLPLTFPISEGQLPLVYDHLPTGRGDDYLDLTGRPLFPFGYGLSYTDFTYSDLRIDAGNVRSGIPAVVTCRVQNTGQRPGNDVVQLYIKDVLASVARPVLQLAAFARVRLEPGASTDVTFRLPADQLQLLAADGRWTVEPGDFRILVGRSSQDIRLRGTLTVQ